VLGGLAIVCGWNSNGVGKSRGFELIDGLVVAHGLHHNDTIVTVEIKIKEVNNDGKSNLQGQDVAVSRVR